MKKNSNLYLLRLLIWKNWKVQIGQKLNMLCVIILPLTFLIVLWLIRRVIHIKYIPEARYSPENINDLSLYYENIAHANGIVMDLHAIRNEIIYSPKNAIYEQIMNITTRKLKLTSYTGYENAQELQHQLTVNSYLAGVEFNDNTANISTYPRTFAFALRFPSELRTVSAKTVVTWRTNSLFTYFNTIEPRSSFDLDGGMQVAYIREGFLPIQHVLSRTYLQLAANVSEEMLPNVMVQRFPYPQYNDDKFVNAMQQLLSLILLLGYVYPSMYIVKCITKEKEKQQQAVMNVMGLPNWLHYIAWFISAFTLLIVIDLLICFMLQHLIYHTGIMVQTSWSLILVFLVLYSFTLTCFCLMISAFFTNSSTAAAVTGILTFATNLPFLIPSYEYDSQQSIISKTLACVLPNTALDFGFRVIMQYARSDHVINWQNVWHNIYPYNMPTLMHVVAALVLSSPLYILLGLYIEQIRPGMYGEHRKWYFPCQWIWRRLSCQRRQIADTRTSDIFLQQSMSSMDSFEKRDTNAGKILLRIENLEKNYRNTIAVNNFSLNLYENEITVLLGHNGAGKTTTILMLAGMLPASIGKINGRRYWHLKGDVSLGICPQHNILFDELSIADHIVLFSGIKGVRGSEALQAEVDKYINLMGLADRTNVKAIHLTSGQKRRLSICCALCGDPKLVLCDEPSSGVDPASRRLLWDLLLTVKMGRTILLTTHYMDEADILGDRIAIMNHGELQCYGSPQYLKQIYAADYNLILMKRDGCDDNKVTDLIMKHIPNAEADYNIGNKLIYRIQTESQSFVRLLNELQANGEQLKVSIYGLTWANMKDVFLRCSDRKNRSAVSTIYPADSTYNLFDTDYMCEQSSMRRLYQQLMGMITKKYLITMCSKEMLFMQIFVPVIFILLVLSSIRYNVISVAQKRLPITLTTYEQAITVLDDTDILDDNSLEARIAHEYKVLAAADDGDKYRLELTAGSKFEDYYLKRRHEDGIEIESIILAAATIGKHNYTAWLNNEPYHVAPLTLNMLYNAIARVMIAPDARIEVTNAPLPYLPTTSNIDMKKNSSGIELGICFCICFFSAFSGLMIVKERYSGTKLLQHLNGANSFIYWLGHFIWDYAQFIIISILLLMAMYLFRMLNLLDFNPLTKLYVMLSFGIAMLPRTYLITQMFRDPATGFSFILIYNFLTGIGMFVLTLTVRSVREARNAYMWYFNILPHFGFIIGLHDITTKDFKIFSRIKKDTEFDMEFSVIKLFIITMLTALFYILVLICIDLEIFDWLKEKLDRQIRRISGGAGWTVIDAEVENVRAYVKSLTATERKNMPLVVNELSKSYKKLIAVEAVSFYLNQGTCFGLTGVNGAGKTSILKMLTFDQKITKGQAYVNNVNIRKSSQKKKIIKQFGYCPEIDALFEELTPRENLRLHCMIRGVKMKSIEKICNSLAFLLGFIAHLDDMVKNCSTGTKRKVSSAIAFIGNPSLIYLDEPTNSSDIINQQLYWQLLYNEINKGKAILIATHNMQEADAVCNQLAIMVNGTIRSIGKPTEIVERFANGIKIQLKLLPIAQNAATQNHTMEIHPHMYRLQDDYLILYQQTVKEIKKFMDINFPDAKLVEEYGQTFTFYLPYSNRRWSEIYYLFQKYRQQLKIEDLTISETTLDDIFMHFASQGHIERASEFVHMRQVAPS